MQILPLRSLLVLTLCSSAVCAQHAAWPHWRGPDRSGVSPETRWSTTGPAEPLWSAKLGKGYSNVAIASGRVYTMGFDEAQGRDQLFCLDLDTGKELWKHTWAAEIRANFHGGGTLSTPTIDGEVVYVLDRVGRGIALDRNTGKPIWDRDYAAELKLRVPFHGFAASPLALPDRLILVLGNTAVSVAKQDGEVRWRTKDVGDGGYANPVPFELKGRRQLAVFAGMGLLVLDTETGKERYRHPWKADAGGVNSCTPIIMGERIFISTAYNLGSALLELGESSSPKVLWKSRKMRNKCSGCVLYEDHIYGFDESMLTCIDLQGKRKWRMRGLGMGSVTIAGGRLIVISSKGELLIGKASSKGFEPEYRRKVLDGGVYWTTPVLFDGRLFCRNSLGHLVCLDHRDGTAIAQAGDKPEVQPAALKVPRAASLFARHAQSTGAAELRKQRFATITGTVEIRDVGLTPSPLKMQYAAPEQRVHTIGHGRFGTGRYGFDAEIAWELDPLFYQRVRETAWHRELVETQSLRALAMLAENHPRAETIGRKRFAGEDCYVVAATSKRGAKRKLYFAVESGRLAGHEAEGESLVSFSDWRAFDGVWIPTTQKRVQADTGNEETIRIESVSFAKVPDAAFARPKAVARMLRSPEEIARDNEVAKKRFASYLGDYAERNPPRAPGLRAKVTVTEGYLSLEPAQGQAYWFLPPDENGVFKGRDTRLELRFRKNAAGEVTGVTLKTSRRDIVLDRK